MPRISKTLTPYSQGDGAVEVKNLDWHNPVTQISLSTDSSQGTLTVKAKYHPEADFEIVYEEDGTTPLTIDLTNLKTFQLYDKWVWSIQFTPTDVDATYTPCLACGRMWDSVR